MNKIDMPPSDPLTALRGATAHQHAILDTGLPLAQADATLQDYRDHLLMLHAWMTPIEDWLAQFGDGPQGPDAPVPIQRSQLIEADLAIGWPRQVAPHSESPGAWPDDASAAYRWGVCYVVEGAQLGGVVLYRRLAEQLAPHPLNYLKGSDEGPGPRWRAFSEALRVQVRGSEQIGQACAGACAAFDRILALRGVRR
jgi:heme oxygenase